MNRSDWGFFLALAVTLVAVAVFFYLLAAVAGVV